MKNNKNSRMRKTNEYIEFNSMNTNPIYSQKNLFDQNHLPRIENFKTKFVYQSDQKKIVRKVTSRLNKKKYLLKSLKLGNRREALKLNKKLCMVSEQVQKIPESNRRFILGNFRSWEENGSAHILKEYHKKRSLSDHYDHLKNTISERVLWFLLHDISHALHILHSENIVHLNTSPFNILLDELPKHRRKSSDPERKTRKKLKKKKTTRRKMKRFKTKKKKKKKFIYQLGNFSQSLKTGKSICFLIDPIFIPPEMLLKKKAYISTDIFIFGLTVYQLASGINLDSYSQFWGVLSGNSKNNLYASKNNQKGSQNNNNNNKNDGNQYSNLELPYKIQRSKKLKNLIKKMLNPDPNQRITSKKLIQNPKIKRIHQRRERKPYPAFNQKLQLSPQLDENNDFQVPFKNLKLLKNNRKKRRLNKIDPRLRKILFSESTGNNNNDDDYYDFDFDNDLDFEPNTLGNSKLPKKNN
ncbi:membrane-associated tyrosine- and threonine-specific cdc2-inhibitory kinase [Anaeramoeba flamelloides]|uniref:Membrane-associated tyrosine- and threonine-specific cdc2-inhibitory kinase n=1 Tax=Anaeramoeba flamelloides TaxID=1746091 RepID=A0ABQ8YIH3_9EUKA|nr:membrane-associated tyrosine- and threonine-specific cdc2-inhibitory kinase [Anaeramoeba flamelloides]